MEVVSEIRFTVYGNPKAQMRHRSARRGRYTAQIDDSKDDKLNFLAQIIQHRPEYPWNKAVSVELVFVVARPKDHFRTGKHAGELQPDAPALCDRRPDLDNCIKLVLDAMNGVFWRDDARVAMINAQKRYDYLPERPRTEVVVRYLNI